MHGPAGAHRVPSDPSGSSRSLPGVHGPSGAHRVPFGSARSLPGVSGATGAHRVPSGNERLRRGAPGSFRPLLECTVPSGRARPYRGAPDPSGPAEAPRGIRGPAGSPRCPRVPQSIPGSGRPSRAGAGGRRSRTPTRCGPRRGGGRGLFTSGSALEDLPNSWNSFPRGGRREGGVAPCLQSEISYPRGPPPAVFSIKVTPSCCRVQEVCTVVKLGFFLLLFKLDLFFFGPRSCPRSQCSRSFAVQKKTTCGCSPVHREMYANTFCYF